MARDGETVLGDSKEQRALRRLRIYTICAPKIVKASLRMPTFDSFSGYPKLCPKSSQPNSLCAAQPGIEKTMLALDARNLCNAWCLLKKCFR